jgi:hypothetical protein
MPDPVDALVLDLLEWLGPQSRPYAEVMDAWRTSCPRLPVWEEANARGFLVHEHREGVGTLVAVSPAGSSHLALQRPHGAATTAAPRVQLKAARPIDNHGKTSSSTRASSDSPRSRT